MLTAGAIAAFGCRRLALRVLAGRCTMPRRRRELVEWAEEACRQAARRGEPEIVRAGARTG